MDFSAPTGIIGSIAGSIAASPGGEHRPFDLAVGTYRHRELGVISFTGHEEMSGLYAFDVVAWAPSNDAFLQTLEPSILGRPAALRIENPGIETLSAASPDAGTGLGKRASMSCAARGPIVAHAPASTRSPRISRTTPSGSRPCTSSGRAWWPRLSASRATMRAPRPTRITRPSGWAARAPAAPSACPAIRS